MVFSVIFVILVAEYFGDDFPLPCLLSFLVTLVSPSPESHCKKPTPVSREGAGSPREPILFGYDYGKESGELGNWGIGG